VNQMCDRLLHLGFVWRLWESLWFPRFAIIPKITGPRRAPYIGSHWDIAVGIKSALDQYKVDTGSYPKSLQDLVQQPGGTTNWHGPYFDPPRPPTDPWGNQYIYHFPGVHNPSGYDLSSMGPDGKEGTQDDIVNWTK
jgi:general secretion pathway protein G